MQHVQIITLSDLNVYFLVIIAENSFFRGIFVWQKEIDVC